MIIDIYVERERVKEGFIGVKPATSICIRAFRWFTGRYVYRERPNCSVELVAFGIIAISKERFA
jgi:hypothetical protein